MTTTTDVPITTVPPAAPASYSPVETSSPWTYVVHRLLAHLGADELTQRLGVSRTTIYAWARARCEPRYGKRIALCDLLRQELGDDATPGSIDSRLDSSVDIAAIRASSNPWQVLAQKLLAEAGMNYSVAAAKVNAKSASVRGWVKGRRPQAVGRVALAANFGFTVDEVEPPRVSRRSRESKSIEKIQVASDIMLDLMRLFTDSFQQEDGSVVVHGSVVDELRVRVDAWLKQAIASSGS